MSYFSSALSQILEQRFEGKQMALAALAGMQTSDISRLIREEAPLTSSKLSKLLDAEGMTENDKHLLTQSAVRDFVGEEAYHTWFVEPQNENTLREDLGGPRFEGLFPLSPRAEQVIRYIVNHAHEPDTTTALELIGKFLELPEPLTDKITSMPAVKHPVIQAIDEIAAQIEASEAEKTAIVNKKIHKAG